MLTDIALPLIYNHSHHLLSVRGCQSPLDVVSFEGHEHLSRPFQWKIEFTSTDHHLNAQQMLLKPASLVLHTRVPQAFGVAVQQPVRTVQGVVTAFNQLSVSRDETRYQLTLQPRLALLRNSRQYAIYQDMSVPQIVEKILRERHGMRGQDFLFDLAQEYPRREQVMQAGETDLGFISRLLAETGIWFRFTTDARLNIDVVEFYDAQHGYAPDITLPVVPPSGMHDGASDAAWGLQSRHQVVEKSVFTRDYNYRDAAADMDAQASVRSDDTTAYGEAYHFADNYLTLGNDPLPEPESGKFYARLHHERYLNNRTHLTGICNAAALTAGAKLRINGTDVDAVFNQPVVITGLHCTARRDRSLETAFSAIPAGESSTWRAPLKPRPVMAGTLPARITSTQENDIYGHIDKDGRYKVTMLFDRASWRPGEESLWVRQARPYAGETYGLHLPLLAGTEVTIAFEDGNPDRPYIAGVLHDSAHPDLVTIANYKRNVLRTPANNKIRLDDNRGKESVKISTDNSGKSQLNLGFLVDQNRDPRGNGFELRTDGWGAIRAGKGLFITADAQPKAQGQVLEMAPAISRLAAAKNEMQAISDDAQTAQASPAELQAQINLLDKQIRDMQARVLHLSAPDGVALTSGEHLQVSAKQNLIVSAGNNADISVVKKLFMGIGAQLSVFVRKLGIKLIANQGPVSVQAQNDTLELLARKGINIVSTEDEIQITAKKRITLNAGGSYITLNAYQIEHATAGDYLTRAGHYARLSQASMPVTMPVLGTAYGYSAIYQLMDQNGNLLINTPWRLTTASGRTLSGYTDQEGKTLPVYTRTPEEVELHIVSKTPQPEEDMWFYGEEPLQMETELREKSS